MMTPELFAELREALEAKEAAREEHARREVKAADARAGALEARKAWRAACDRVEEIEAEIRTGLSGMPLVDLAVPKVEAPPVEPRRFVPKSAADHEPVRVAKGSPRAAGVAR